MELVIYSKDGCPYCHLMTHVFDDNNIPYRVVDLSDDAKREEFYESSHTRTVPQAYLTGGPRHLARPYGVSLGGWSDVKNNLSFIANALKEHENPTILSRE